MGITVLKIILKIFVLGGNCRFYGRKLRLIDPLSRRLKRSPTIYHANGNSEYKWEIEHGLCALRRDNPRALARGLSTVQAHKPCSISLVPQ